MNTFNVSKEIDEQALLEPFSRLLRRSREDVWKEIPMALNHWLRIPEEKLEDITDTFLTICTSIVMIDDIQDDSGLRYGLPTAQRIYGLAHTINASIHALFLGLQKSLTLSPDGICSIAEPILEIFRGQGKDILWRESCTCPNEEQYITMVKQKAGGYVNIAAGLMKLFSDDKRDFKPLCDNLGTYIQIINDYDSLKSAKMEMEKGFAEDLSEGKFSFPIIHGIKSHPENNELISILKQKPSDVSLKKHCIEYLESVGSFEYTESIIRKLDQTMADQIEKFGGNEMLMKFIRKMSEKFLSP